MRTHRILSFLLVICLLGGMMILPATAESVDLQLQCTNAVLIDASYGEVLYEQSAYDQAYPASMTKVMTALLTLEAIADGTITEDTMVTVSEYASMKTYSDESTANLLPGEQMSIKDLLYCLMLPSANDAAKALAEHLGGSCDAFVQEMNARAKELGCKGTHFVNPNGLHDPNHYSTAYDIALIYKAAMEHNLFNTIVLAKDYTTAATNLNGERYFFNTNGLISNYYYGGHVYDKCIGGKTGSTTEAGKCLVAAARDGDKVMISVIMGSGPIVGADGSERLGQFDESKRLLEYGLMNFRRITLTQPEEAVATVAVSFSADGKEVGVIPQGSISVMLHNNFNQKDVKTKITLFEDTIEAPVVEGQVLGTMRLYTDEQDFGDLELVAERSMEYSKKLYRQSKRQDFMDRIGRKILIVFFILLMLPMAALITLRCVNVYRRKQRKKRAAQRRAAQRRAAQQPRRPQQ